jgi:two-component system KDP operon response regulator KdpE
VDDEPGFRKALKTSLTATGFTVEEAGSGEEALRALIDGAIDLVLLDINMPGMGGLEACRRIRALGRRIGIIMATVRDSEDDKVHALDSGADDYITKPFRLRELAARLRAVLRRVTAEDAPAETVVRAGALEIDLERRLCRKAGTEIHLSPTEFDVLALLVRHRGGPVSHLKLLRTIWGPEYGGELEYLRTYIKMLRRKIEDDPTRPEYILTEPWLGYRFRDPSDPDPPEPQSGDD